jgi:lactate racemase
MKARLQYGKRESVWDVPEHTVIAEIREPEFRVSKDAFTRELEDRLPKENDHYNQVAVVVSDKTRLCGYPDYLPWLVEILLKRVSGKENITFYIAYGTHARQTEEESLAAYGPLYKQFRFVHHDCTDEGTFVTLGTTSRGTPVTVRKDILASTLLITFGAITYHYFAAYGGGRKLLFPGLASKGAILHNHSLFLDTTTRSLAAGCQPGNFTGNPLAEDLKDMDPWLPPRISIHGIMDASGKVCRLMMGTDYEDFLNACRVHDHHYRYPGTAEFDLVMASCGGYPKDINFIQAHKAIHHAAAFVRDCGQLVILAECIDGIASPSFMKYIHAGSFEAAFALLEKNYEGNGATALAMLAKTKRIRIHMMTSLDEATCKPLGVFKVDEAGIQKIIQAETGSIALIANASMLIRKESL